jgi:hypothetical protein
LDYRADEKCLEELDAADSRLSLGIEPFLGSVFFAFLTETLL